MEPNKIPNLNHSLFNGVNNLELRTPKIKSASTYWIKRDKKHSTMKKQF